MEFKSRGGVILVISIIKSNSVLGISPLEIRFLVLRYIDGIVEFSTLRIIIILWNRIA